MSAQCDSSFFIHFIPSPGQLAINFLLCTSILECKILLIAFFANSLTFYPPILDNLAFLHKYLYIGKISSPLILQMLGNKYRAGTDPHPV